MGTVKRSPVVLGLSMSFGMLVLSLLVGTGDAFATTDLILAGSTEQQFTTNVPVDSLNTYKVHVADAPWIYGAAPISRVSYHMNNGTGYTCTYKATVSQGTQSSPTNVVHSQNVAVPNGPGAWVDFNFTTPPSYSANDTTMVYITYVSGGSGCATYGMFRSYYNYAYPWGTGDVGFAGSAHAIVRMNIYADNILVCGDGVVGGTEACDDGDSLSGDGCSSACAVESGYSCTGEPSTCTQVREISSTGFTTDSISWEFELNYLDNNGIRNYVVCADPVGVGSSVCGDGVSLTGPAYPQSVSETGTLSGVPAGEYNLVVEVWEDLGGGDWDWERVVSASTVTLTGEPDIGGLTGSVVLDVAFPYEGADYPPSGLASSKLVARLNRNPLVDGIANVAFTVDVFVNSTQTCSVNRSLGNYTIAPWGTDVGISLADFDGDCFAGITDGDVVRFEVAAFYSNLLARDEVSVDIVDSATAPVYGGQQGEACSGDEWWDKVVCASYSFVGWLFVPSPDSVSGLTSRLQELGGADFIGGLIPTITVGEMSGYVVEDVRREVGGIEMMSEQDTVDWLGLFWRDNEFVQSVLVGLCWLLAVSAVMFAVVAAVRL